MADAPDAPVVSDTHRELAESFGLSGVVAPTHRWVQSASANHINGLIWGTGAAQLLLVHDLGDTAHGWDAVAMHLDRPLVAIDLPGHGQSSAAKPGNFSPGKSAAAVLDAIQSFAPAASAIVATGFGAAIALHAAARRPAAFRSLVVVDGAPGASGVGPLIDEAGFDDRDAVAERLRSVAPGRSAAFTANTAATATRQVDGRMVWRYQLGPVGDLTDEGLPPWASSLTGIARPQVPVSIIAADVTRPNDPIVALLLERWPDVRTVSIGGPAGDIQALSPQLLARAVEGIIDAADRLDQP